MSDFLLFQLISSWDSSFHCCGFSSFTAFLACSCSSKLKLPRPWLQFDILQNCRQHLGLSAPAPQLPQIYSLPISSGADRQYRPKYKMHFLTKYLRGHIRHMLDTNLGKWALHIQSLTFELFEREGQLSFFCILYLAALSLIAAKKDMQCILCILRQCVTQVDQLQAICVCVHKMKLL